MEIGYFIGFIKYFAYVYTLEWQYRQYLSKSAKACLIANFFALFLKTILGHVINVFQPPWVHTLAWYFRVPKQHSASLLIIAYAKSHTAIARPCYRSYCKSLIFWQHLVLYHLIQLAIFHIYYTMDRVYACGYIKYIHLF